MELPQQLCGEMLALVDLHTTGGGGNMLLSSVGAYLVEQGECTNLSLLCL